MSTHDFVTVWPPDYQGKFYWFHGDIKDDGIISLGNNNPKIGYTACHPGTSRDSDTKDDVNAQIEYPDYHINETAPPIITSLSRYLLSVAIDGPDRETLWRQRPHTGIMFKFG